MLSDDELPPLPYPHMSSGVAHYHSGFTYAQMREYARAAERAAYERAAQECDPHEDDDRIDRQIKRELAERILALGRQ